MKVDAGLSAIVRNVIRIDRNCHRLMIAYYLLAVVLVLVGCFLFPSAGKPIIAAGFVAGVLLLIGVTVVTRRALRPLRAIRPDLTEIPASARAQLKSRRGGPTQPHYGAGGAFYVFMLVFMAAAGAITRGLPGGAWGNARFRKETRRPWLASLEAALNQ